MATLTIRVTIKIMKLETLYWKGIFLNWVRFYAAISFKVNLDDNMVTKNEDLFMCSVCQSNLLPAIHSMLSNW